VFEIGNSLREARMRRGLDFAQAELATKVRGKYLRALEEEQFDVLPAQTYVKGFLRTYAEYLGLDGQLYVDEYNSRFVGTGDDHEPRSRRSAARPARRHRRIETNVVLIVLAGIAILMVVIISAWKATDNNSPTPPRATHPITQRRRVPAPLLTLTGLRGSTHVAARVGSASGNVAFDGTISKGDTPLALRARRLWLQIDSPENLRISVRGKLVHVPGLQPRVIIVTPAGWHPA
jgi:cytoskeleton protein RodZ